MNIIDVRKSISENVFFKGKKKKLKSGIIFMKINKKIPEMLIFKDFCRKKSSNHLAETSSCC